MQISELTLKLIIVLLPGLIASIIFEKLTIHSKWTPFKFSYNSILFGSISYLSAHVAFIMVNFITCSRIDFIRETVTQFNLFWQNLSTKEIHFEIVIWASISAVVVASVGSLIDYKRVLNRLGNKLNITTKYGDESLYYKFLNSKDILEIYIRDEAADLTYHGLIDSYSESDGCSEILLRDVMVYCSSDPSESYAMSYIYLCKNRNDLVIEVPQ